MACLVGSPMFQFSGNCQVEFDRFAAKKTDFPGYNLIGLGE